MVTCSRCGATNPPGARFCSGCGAQFTAAVTPQTTERDVARGIQRQKDAESATRVIAGIAAFPLWGLGFKLLSDHQNWVNTWTVLAVMLGPPTIGYIVGLWLTGKALHH
jgi:hypothetical protein